MVSKLVLVLAVLIGVSAATISAVRPALPLSLRTSLKISKLSGEPLIKAACQGIGDNETECVSVLQSAPSDQKADANNLLIFTLRYVEKHAETIVAGIKNISCSEGDVSPLLQSALTDCTEQYNSIDDLIETAANAVLGNNYAEAQQIIIAAVSSIDLCDWPLQASTGQAQMEKGLKKYNLLHRNLLLAALNILTVD